MISVTTAVLLGLMATADPAPPGVLTGVAQGEPAILESEYAKWRASLPDDYPQLADYRRMLLSWVVGAEQYWLEDPAHPKLGKCRFTTKHVHVRTARVLPAYAALAADPDCKHPVWTRQKLIERINSAIGFLCDTYSFDNRDKAPKGSWSKRPSPNSLRYETWVIGNMVDALQIVSDAITPENKQGIRKILIDMIEDERTSGRAKSLKDYRHEGIIWPMNLLARAAVLYADDPKADEWLDLAKHGYASSLSVEADSQDETVVDGKPIKEWVSRRQGVFYPDFTLSHHGLGIHPGYMAIGDSLRPGVVVDVNELHVLQVDLSSAVQDKPSGILDHRVSGDEPSGEAGQILPARPGLAGLEYLVAQLTGEIPPVRVGIAGLHDGVDQPKRRPVHQLHSQLPRAGAEHLQGLAL